MNVFKTYQVKVTFEMVTHESQGREDYKKLVEASLLSEVQNKIRLCLNDTKGLLFGNLTLTVEGK